LTVYNQSAAKPLTELEAGMEKRQDKADGKLRDFLGRKSVYKALNRYTTLIATEGAGLLDEDSKAATVRVRHVLPELIFRRLGAVRAYGDILETATPTQFHQLRIQFKELRYTLTFFEDILDGSGSGVIESSRRVQDHLGDLNDTVVALGLLKDIRCCPTEAAVYSAFQKAEMARLMAEFTPLYEAFDTPGLRRDLACVLAGL
jgi:CHAD domain-containing protein